MHECNYYLSMNHPLVTVPGRDIDMDAIHAQMERCRVKGCSGTSCCANLSTMSLNAHERMHTCMVDDAVDEDCKVCCWILNGLKCVNDPTTSGCDTNGKTSSVESVYPPLASKKGVYMGCQNYEQVFPQLMTNFQAAEKVDPMHAITEEFVASLVANDTVHSRTTGYEGSHPVYTPEYTNTAVRDIVYPVLDAYAAVWQDDIRTDVYNRAQHAMLDTVISNHPEGTYLPPTLYCMESTGMCTLGGDGLTRGRSATGDTMPTVAVGGKRSFDRIEWVNQRPLTIDNIQGVRSIQSHRHPPAYVNVGSNIMRTDTTLGAPRLERST